MRSLKFFIMTGVMLLSATAFADDLGRVRLSFLDGDVQVRIKDTTDWTDAAVNLPLNEGDRLWIPGNSQAELQLRGGVYVRADQNTALDILTVNHDSAQLYLDRGHIYINNRRGGIRNAQIDTPISSLRSYDNSVLMVDVSEEGVTQVSVLKGYVYAESRAGATRVSEGNMLTLRGEHSAELSPAGPPDEWERWNSERDQYAAAEGESVLYLPDELGVYASDFDRHGRWDYVGEYGSVWVPTSAPAGWAPYSYGSWIWIRGNYVWLDYNPWGWAPSHYGRWTFVASRGWCWVPPAAGAVYWGPGFVGWIVTPTYVAWLPLAPGEIYYGYGYYGPGSVNITMVNTVVVNRNYAHAGINDSVTIVRRDTFGTGKRTPVKRENPFLQVQQSRQSSADVQAVPPRERPGRPIVVVPREERNRLRQRFSEQPGSQTTPGTRTVTPGFQTEPRTVTVTPTPRRFVRPEGTSQPSVTRRSLRGASEQQAPPERVRRTNPDAVKRERPLVKNQDSSVFHRQQPENLSVTRSKEPRQVDRTPRITGQQGKQPLQRTPEKRERPGR